MKVHNWKELLHKWHDELTPYMDVILAARTPYSSEVPAAPDAIYNQGATELEISKLEKRLKISLPGSYANFLRASNGVILLDLEVELLPTGSVGWARDLLPSLVNDHSYDYTRSTDEEYYIYGAEQDCISYRPEYLTECLVISSNQDGYVYLLNPCVKTSDGEWEAWDFGNKYPGAYRYKDFGILMTDVYMQLGDRISEYKGFV